MAAADQAANADRVNNLIGDVIHPGRKRQLDDVPLVVGYYRLSSNPDTMHDENPGAGQIP